MAQVLEFKLPDLGEGLTEAEIVRWLVEVGDVVAIDQPVVEVETAKAMVEVPCPYGGVVTARFGEEGTELPVGAPLLTVAVGATESSSSLGTAADQAGPRASRNGGAAADGSAAGAGQDSGSGSGNVLVGYGTGAPAARRRRIRPQPTALNGTPAAASASASASASGSTAPGPVVAGPLTGSASASAGPVAGAAPATALAGDVNGREGPVAVVSPLVRRLARQHEIDLRRLTGSGPDGLILRADVDAAIRLAGEAAEAESRSADAPAQRAVPERTASGEAAAERVPLRGVRGAVADKLSRSRTEIPDATCWVDADATELMAVRAAMNAATGPSAGPKVSVLALLARICTAALARYPELNSTVDTEAREIVRLPACTSGSRPRPSGASSSRSSGTRTPATPSRSGRRSPG